MTSPFLEQPLRSPTPKPWWAHITATTFTVVAERGRVAHMAIKPTSTRSEEGRANAFLIAAAPELLEACEEFVRKVDAGEDRSTQSYAQMKAAIAKARGSDAAL